MGFRTGRTAEARPKVILIASVEAGTGEIPTDSLDGADGVLLRSGKSTLNAKSLQKTASSLPDLPWGLYLEDDDGKKAAAAVEAGGDFLVFTAASEIIATPKEEKTGKILQIDSSMDDGLLRAVNDLPVDAALITDEAESHSPLVWHQLMIFQHLSNLLSKPLIIPASADITEKELKALWDAGMDGILVETDATKTEALKDLRKIIDNLPARAGRKRGKIEARLPHAVSEEAQPVIPEQEEEEEEDE